MPTQPAVKRFTSPKCKMDPFCTSASAKIFGLSVSIEIGGKQVAILLKITPIVYDTYHRRLHGGRGSCQANLVGVIMIRGGTYAGARLVPGTDVRQGCRL